MNLLDWTLMIGLLWSPEQPPLEVRVRLDGLRAALDRQEPAGIGPLAADWQQLGRAARERRLRLAAEAAAAYAWARVGQRQRAYQAARQACRRAGAFDPWEGAAPRLLCLWAHAQALAADGRHEQAAHRLAEATGLLSQRGHEPEAAVILLLEQARLAAGTGNAAVAAAHAAGVLRACQNRKAGPQPACLEAAGIYLNTAPETDSAVVAAMEEMIRAPANRQQRDLRWQVLLAQASLVCLQNRASAARLIRNVELEVLDAGGPAWVTERIRQIRQQCRLPAME